MTKSVVVFFAGAISLAALGSWVDAGQVRLSADGTNQLIQVLGDPDDDWHFQSTGDLVTWSEEPALGYLLSGRTNAPTRILEPRADGLRFYRAIKSGGLYDPTVLRTIHLTFAQANWQTLLTSGRTTGSNTACLFTMDNGAAMAGAGARYRGNTSFTGMGGGSAPLKKSVNLELDYTDPSADLMGYDTLNLNNAYGDETIMRESVYFNVMRQYTVCPKGSLVKLYINGAHWGVYSLVQQQDGDLIREYFPSNDGDRWRAPNMGGGGGPGGGPGGGTTGTSALGYLGNTNVATYQRNYELKSTYHTNALPRLIHAIYVLNNTPAAQFRDQVEYVLAVDRWLWFLALENIFADDDSYWNKGADYMMYYEPETGRVHPVEHDGNEAFVAGDVSLTPVQGATAANRPVLSKLLSVPELRQRYLAHMRTALEESFHPAVLLPVIDRTVALTVADIVADPKKTYTMTAYTNDLNALKNFVRQRYTFLTNHAELRPVPPTVVAVSDPKPKPTAAEIPFVTAEVRANGADGIDSVWLYHRAKSYGRFTAVQMFDDGAHGDGAAGDGVFGGATAAYPAATKVRYYVEARSANTAKAASFSPARAEEDTYSYRVKITLAPNSAVVINEIMASNTQTLADPQGEFDDWIELRNVTDREVDLTGRYLSDDPTKPRKWAFPAGTTIPPDGYLLVWADDDGKAADGLHTNFNLSAGGEQLLLIDDDANLNAVLDLVTFGPQKADRSYGRSAADADAWEIMDPTPGQANR
jgi:hypothetical protein